MDTTRGLPVGLGSRKSDFAAAWVLMVLGLVLAVTGAVALWLAPSNSQPGGGAPTFSVEIDSPQSHLTVNLVGVPTVRAALEVAGVRPDPSHLLSAGSHQPIPGFDAAPTVLLNGVPVKSTAELTGPWNHIEVLRRPDTIEAVVVRPGTVILPAPLPQVLRTLWHPGSPGQRSEARVGAVSGELLDPVTMVPPSAPAPVTEKLVALTFDDGPWPDTGQFLDALQAAGVKATFCMIGRQVIAHPDWVNAVVSAGMTVCNHTMNHDTRLDVATPATVRGELQGGADALTAVLGRAPTLYRPPGGTLTPLIEDTAGGLGEQVIHWSVDPADYTRPGTATIVSRVMAQVQPGSIILLHDGGGDRSQTLAALTVLLTTLKSQGYGFTTPDAVSPVPVGPAQVVTPASPLLATTDGPPDHRSTN